MTSKKKKSINRTDLARLCNINRSVITRMVKQGKLPDSKEFDLASAHIKTVIKAYQNGIGLKGIPKFVDQKTIKKKLVKTPPKKKPRKTAVKKSKEKTKDPEIEEKIEKAKKLIEEMGDVDLENYEELLSLGFTEQMDKIEDDLRIRAVLSKNPGERKVLIQTLEGIEKIKKNKLSNLQAQDKVVPQDQVVWFFSKYFNSLNDDLLELPESGLSGKILGAVRKKENRKDIVASLSQLFNDLDGKSKEERGELIRVCAEGLSSDAEDREIEIEITSIFQAEITKRLENTKRAILGHKFLGGDKDGN